MSETFEPRRVCEPCHGHAHPFYLCDDECPQFESTEHGPARGCLLMPAEWEGLGEYCGPVYFAQRMLRGKVGLP